MPANLPSLWLDSILPAEQLHRLGWVVVHSLWQAAAVAAVLAVALRILPRRSTLALEARYVLSTLALTALPMACAVTYAIVEPPAAAVAVERTASPGVTDRVVVVPVTIASNVDRGAMALTQTAVSSVALVAHRAADAIAPWLPWCAAVWLAGAMAAAARLGGGWWLTRRLVAQAIVPADTRWQAGLDRWTNVLGIARRVRLLASPRIDVPMVVGWLEPVVLWPLAALTGMPPDQIDAIIAHELAHVRRHDVFVNLLQSCVETLFFHHPAAWWISAQVRAEREHCADDLAIRALTAARAGSALSYATALVSLEEQRQRSAFAVAADGGSLVDRIARLAGVEPTTGHPARLAAALLVAVVLVTGVAALATSSRPAEAADRTDALPEDTNAITSLTPEQAAKLAAKFPGVKAKIKQLDLPDCLPLNGVTSLDVETAKALAAYDKGPLLLDGLTTLSPEAAAALATGKRMLLSLNGLTTLSPETAKGLAAFSGQILTLNGLTTLSPQAAAALATFTGMGLQCERLTELTPDTAKALAEFTGHGITLGATTLSPEAAAALAASKSAMLVFVSLTDLSPEAGRALAGFAGHGLLLDRLEKLPVEAARDFRVEMLSLNGLKKLSPEGAAALASSEVQYLALNGLTELPPEVVAKLVGFQGSIACNLLEEFRTRAVDEAKTLTPNDAALLACSGASSAGFISVPGVMAFDTPDSIQIADILAQTKKAIMFPNLKRISPRTFAALVRNENVLLPDMKTVEIIPEPDGSNPTVADDFVLPDGFEEQQKQLRLRLALPR